MGFLGEWWTNPDLICLILSWKRSSQLSQPWPRNEARWFPAFYFISLNEESTHGKRKQITAVVEVCSTPQWSNLLLVPLLCLQAKLIHKKHIRDLMITYKKKPKVLWNLQNMMVVTWPSILDLCMYMDTWTHGHMMPLSSTYFKVSKNLLYFLKFIFSSVLLATFWE